MSNYTKSGFSKSFGCCSNHKFCELGKKTCWYAERDAETMESCAAWQRHNLPSKPYQRISLPIEPVIQTEVMEILIEEPIIQLEPLELDLAIEVKVQVKEQLTLF